LIIDDNGVPASCTIGLGANLTIRNALNGTELLTNVAMTKFATGLYNYTYSVTSQDL